MNQMQQDKVEKWKRWAEAIQEEVEELLVRRYVRTELTEVIDRNPEIQKPSLFYEWLPVVYTHTQVMGIRRMTDNDKQAASLANLIQEIRDFPTTAQAHADATPIIINRDRIEREVPGASTDYQRIVKTYDPLKAYANKRVAHRDGRALENLPKYGDITAAIDLIEDFARTYYVFVSSKDLQLMPVIAYPWMQIFTVPWIPSDRD
jgi:hypothetical protein